MHFRQWKRREVITLVGGAAATWPLAAHAQQPAMPVIGFLSGGSPSAFVDFVAAFHKGLNETGYVEHRSVGIDYRWAEGQYDRLPTLAADLVRRQVAVIAAGGGDVSALAAKRATATIPVVFNAGSDPVKLGLVSSLSRPGSNLTGVGQWAIMLAPKRLEILRELVPISTIAVLVNPSNPTTESQLPELQAAARALALRLHVETASNEREIDAAFTALVQQRPGALLVGSDPFFSTRRDQIVALAARHRLPAIYGRREFTAAGGLISYDSNLADAYRLVGVYAGRILKGEKPADLPVQQATKVELFINLRTAKVLGLDVPATLLARADEVIE